MAKRGTAAKRAGNTLERYRAKRDFTRTPEPPGGKVTPETSVFVVQKHAARRLHYDLRLQFGATLKSWAVPQGPSLDPAIRRLAVHTEDHPLEYADFEERIPQGQYGAGGMIVWDRGTWIPMGDPEADYRKGTLKFRLSGEKLGGGWMLVRLKPKEGERGDNWLLIKERDPFARPGSAAAIVEERPESVLSGRLVEDLAASEAPPEPARARKPRPARPSALQGARKAPLPRTFRPQLASPAARPPEGEEWLHEIKFDGYRTIARIDGDEVRLCTRTGLDWTERYGVLVEAFRRLPCKQALIDGEIVVQDEHGIASFAALQDALAEGRTQALIFFAFDLMYLDGYDLTATPLLERKRALHALLDPAITSDSALQISEHVLGHGRAFLEQAAQLGLEGVISKRANAPYEQTRTRTWLKSKCRLSDDFLIVGYSPSDVAGGIGALLLAEAEDGGLRYVGRVGTGFSMTAMKSLVARLEALRAKKASVTLPPAEKRKGIVWVRPALVAEVEYANRTADGILRHAVYKGLRSDKAEEATFGADARPAAGRTQALRQRCRPRLGLGDQSRSRDVRRRRPEQARPRPVLCPGRRLDHARADQPAGVAGALPDRQGRGLLLPAARHAGHAGGDQTHSAARGGLEEAGGLPVRRGRARTARARPVRRDRVPHLGLPGRPARAPRSHRVRPRSG